MVVNRIVVNLLIFSLLLTASRPTAGSRSSSYQAFEIQIPLTSEALAARVGLFRFSAFNRHPFGLCVGSLVLLVLASGAARGQIRPEWLPLLNPGPPLYDHFDRRRRADEASDRKRREDRDQAGRAVQARWAEFVDGKNFVIAQRLAGHDAAADGRIAHLLAIALGEMPSYQEGYTGADRAYAQGALTLLSLEGSPSDRAKAMEALLRLARTDHDWSNHVADRRDNLDTLAGFMEGRSGRAWRAAAVLRSADIPDAFIDRALVMRLLIVTQRRQEGLGSHPSTNQAEAAKGIREVFRWNVLNREKGTAAALEILYDPRTPAAQARFLESELVASGNEIPMRKDDRARRTFAPGLKRLDDQRADAARAAAVQKAGVERQIAKNRRYYQNENRLFMGVMLLALIAASMELWLEGLLNLLQKARRRFRGTSILLILSVTPWIAASWRPPQPAILPTAA